MEGKDSRQMEAYRGQGLQHSKERTKNMTSRKRTACVIQVHTCKSRKHNETKTSPGTAFMI